MSGIHRNGRNCDFEKTHPGCLGRMVSLFELNIGVPANRLLNDRPKQNGSPLPMSRSDVSSMSPSVDPIEERVIAPEFKRSILDGKSNRTPMKMLIAQEMSKEVDFRRDQPNLVAKLMQPDVFPQLEPDSAMLRSQTSDHPQSHSFISSSYCEQENGFFHSIDPNTYEDVHEIWQQSQKSSHVARFEENIIHRKMALVRQKFIEAKRLSMNEEHQQSKQFKDALEVLTSNRDLFLKCPRELDPMFSANVYSQQSVSHPPGTKRITVLRPSKMEANNDDAGNKDGIPKKKEAFLQVSGLQKVHPGSSPPASLKYDENSTLQTRIVVLKPSRGKARDVKAVGSLNTELRRMLHREELFGDDENQESREVAKAITQKVREKVGGLCKDETLISSIISNGYAGDESSSNKSEVESADNLSDSEATSPVSRSSWDYISRLNLYSSSLTRASYSAESSVCREAKKRLYKRWAMMAYNGVCQEQGCFKRSSSTLGEMLALSETKTKHADEGSSSQEAKDSNTLLVDEHRRGENMHKSPRNLLRSKSVPVSTTESVTSLSLGISILDKSESLKETKSQSAKSSFKGKVSSLFFSRNKVPGNDKYLAPDVTDEYYLSPGETYTSRTESFRDKGSTCVSPFIEPSSKASSSNQISKQGMISPKAQLFVEKPIAFVNRGENQDHPSPVSVLDPPYEVDEHIEKVFPHCLQLDQQRVEPPLNSIQPYLLDKSPPIGSMTRSLSCDGSSVNTDPSQLSRKPFTSGETIEQEQELFIFVKALLSMAGLQGDMQSNSFSRGWYSLESPLDPTLRDKYIDFKDKNPLQSANQRQTKAGQKLVFDCVNEALLDIAGYGSQIGQRTTLCIGAIANNFVLSNSRPSTLLDEVWAQMKVWFSGELDDYTDMVVRKEVVGMQWSHHFSLEVVNLGKAIERRLLEEFLLEVVVELGGTT